MAKKKILVVDDEPDFVNVIRLRLEAHNYEVVTAFSGKEALQKLTSLKPDAVFLDIMMPNLDGLQVLKKIRSRNKDLPVFIITAFSNEERFRLAKKLSASGFLVKTGDLQKEIQNIKNVIGVADKYRGRVVVPSKSFLSKLRRKRL